MDPQYGPTRDTKAQIISQEACQLFHRGTHLQFDLDSGIFVDAFSPSVIESEKAVSGEKFPRKRSH